MGDKSRFLGRLSTKDNQHKIDVRVDLIEYLEDDIYYVYSPALDLVGYGLNKDEARRSWETILAEYLRYTTNKKTLVQDLKDRGWLINTINKFTPPSVSWMLQNNQNLSELYDKHDFNKVTTSIRVPLQEIHA